MSKATSTVTSEYRGIKFSDSDVINPGDYIPAGEYNPRNVRPFLLHDHGFVLAVVFATDLQEALDEAVGADSLDRYLVDLSSESTREDYLTADFAEAAAGLDEECPEWTAEDGTPYWWRDGMEPAHLGNASEPFDIESLGVLELPNPAWSFCALFTAAGM